jgi:hypothetical protein
MRSRFRSFADYYTILQEAQSDSQLRSEPWLEFLTGECFVKFLRPKRIDSIRANLPLVMQRSQTTAWWFKLKAHAASVLSCNHVTCFFTTTQARTWRQFRIVDEASFEQITEHCIWVRMKYISDSLFDLTLPPITPRPAAHYQRTYK